MVKKIIALGVLLVMCFGIFSGCNTGIWFKVGYGGEGGFGFKEEGESLNISVLTIMNSLDEMKDLCEEWNNPAYQEDSEYFSSEISKKIREYTEAYFEEKTLIVCSALEVSPAKSPRIKSIRTEEAKLIINVRYDLKKGTFNDIATTWLFLIEVKKADIAGVETVQINEK